MNEHDKQQTAGTPGQESGPAVVLPADMPRIAENPNPRANENINNSPSDTPSSTNTVGSEITDGEAG